MSHDVISAEPAGTGSALISPLAAARRQDSLAGAPSPESVPVIEPGRLPAPVPRIPAYRWRMMVALAAVVSSGFLMGMLLAGASYY